MTTSAIIYGVGALAAAIFLYNLIGSLMKSLFSILIVLAVVYLLSLNNIIPVGVSEEMTRIFMEYKDVVIAWISDSSSRAVDALKEPATAAFTSGLEKAGEAAGSAAAK